MLHRVVKVLDGGYLICGDNRTSRERVPEEWIIGVMTGYFEKGKDDFISCENEKYRSYVRALKARKIIRQMCVWPKRLAKKLFF